MEIATVTARSWAVTSVPSGLLPVRMPGQQGPGSSDSQSPGPRRPSTRQEQGPPLAGAPAVPGARAARWGAGPSAPGAQGSSLLFLARSLCPCLVALCSNRRRKWLSASHPSALPQDWSTSATSRHPAGTAPSSGHLRPWPSAGPSISPLSSCPRAQEAPCQPRTLHPQQPTRGRVGAQTTVHKWMVKAKEEKSTKPTNQPVVPLRHRAEAGGGAVGNFFPISMG